MNEPNPEPADRVAAIFDRLVEEPEEDWDHLLDRFCRRDRGLRDEIASLLRAHRSSEGFLEALDTDRTAALLAEDEERGMPERAGPYRLVETLGRGGMGAVYLGKRVEGGFEQRVAVKLLKRGMDSDALVTRFLTERQILARLEHPRIARLVDGGVAEDGRPYFAMEYVDGEPLLDWCDRHRLPVRERLFLFSKICRAVQSAHAKLVVHRDLKPANILVTTEGEPKLLDFGIAKLLAESGADETALTLAARRPMTPAYAAPEQIRGEPVTVATDVYSLGVLLYELLTGRHPYGDATTSPSELEEAVCTTVPPAPSAAVASEASREDAAARGTRLDRLRRHLRGDLDTIVLRALAKDPERRYASVEALADDVTAYLEGLPIKARPDTAAYRARRFVGRHRAAVIAAVSVVLALTVGLGLAIREGRIAERERDRAQLEADRARQVQQFLVDLFEASDPGEARGEDTTARELLERGVERIDGELASQPEAQAELLGVIGEVYRELGRYDRATELLERGVALSREGQAAEPLRLAHLLKLLGQAMTADGRYDEAEGLLRESIALRERHSGPDSVETGESLDALAVTLHSAGDLDAAEPLYRRAYGIYRSELDEGHESVLTTLNNLAVLANDRGRFDEAARLHRRVLEFRRGAYGEDHPLVAITLTNLARALRSGGRLAEAAETQRLALEIKTAIYDENHPSLATSWNNLGVNLRSLGDYPEAEKLFTRVLRADRESLGPDHAYVGISLDNLASVVAEQGRIDEALDLLDRAGGIHRRAIGEDSARFATHLTLRARVLELAGDDESAASLFDRALGIYRRNLSDDHFRTAGALTGRARLLHRIEGPEVAVPVYLDALSIQRETLPENHPDTAVTLLGLGHALHDLGRFGEAEEAITEALRIRRAAFSTESWPVHEIRASLGAVLCARGRSAKGRDLFDPAIEAMAIAPGSGHPSTTTVRALGSFCSSAPGRREASPAGDLTP